MADDTCATNSATLQITGIPASAPGEDVADLVDATMANADTPLERDAVEAAARALVKILAVSTLGPVRVELVIGVVAINLTAELDRLSAEELQTR